ncbi:uncharacterized protein [Gossypium hirsutum]|uniref:Uncharacterized protein n=1 Tax=Gossypium hirsutum TaxID=3635 RepID=A0A1U8NW21_GOSHI|nr:uncharacterized protein LOC107952416 [Gossypium hirsutum]
MAPFEEFYGRKCRTPLCWFDMEGKRNLGPDLVGDKVFLKVFHLPLRGLEEGFVVWAERSDPSHVVPIEEIEVRSDVSYEEEPVAIFDCEIKVLRSKTIPLVKVLWRNHKTEEAT